jgi:hypothetical protein
MNLLQYIRVQSYSIIYVLIKISSDSRGLENVIRVSIDVYVNPHMVTNTVWKWRVPKWYLFMSASPFPYGDYHMETMKPNGNLFSCGDIFLNSQMVTDTI